MYEVKMPRLGVTMQNGMISKWLVQEGDEVDKGDYLFELETEKTTLEIEAQESGVLRKIIAPVGEEVPVNTTIAVLANPDEKIDLSIYEQTENQSEELQTHTGSTKTSVHEPQKIQKRRVVPKARKLAKELNVTLDNITGTGRGGIITQDDVRSASSSDKSIARVKEVISMNHVQKTMAKNISDSWKTIPQFTQMVTVDMQHVMDLKNSLSDISLNDIIVKAVGNAVNSFSFVNSKLEENYQITVYEDINISLAINSSLGLVVPVIKNVEGKSVYDISQETKLLAEKAELNRLTPEDYEGGTITVSNLGSMGIENGTPIVNSPQSTIVFAGAVREIPVVDENHKVIVSPVMNLSICYDHRFIDGVTGAKFTNAVKSALEDAEVSNFK